ncbi:protein spaetzle [Daphnia magna]|uniref:Uncharacterized protein n=2 Tax=Daphnia magna TaxID=35525 RepID=A0A0P5GXK9_9CRUS|nr:protein spaetzle [Daphnia magna]KAK4012658.1 hypothetical protein OUZ56_024895 [Daphnia magna]KZS18313.1 Uncharacterized protein APZ42_015565 [Daphnia magna]
MSLKFLSFASLVVVAMANGPNVPPYKPGYPAAKYDDVPLCAKNSSKPWCLSDEVYPIYDIQKALNQYHQEVLALYKDVKAITPNSVDELKDLEEETYLCTSSTTYVQPLRAVNVDGKWRVIVNNVESYNYLFTQSARIEECNVDVGSNCPLVPSCYESRCVQKNIFHRFLVFDPYDYYFPFAIEKFQLPASCGCVIGAYFP